MYNPYESFSGLLEDIGFEDYESSGQQGCTCVRHPCLQRVEGPSRALEPADAGSGHRTALI